MTKKPKIIKSGGYWHLVVIPFKTYDSKVMGKLRKYIKQLNSEIDND